MRDCHHWTDFRERREEFLAAEEVVQEGTIRRT